MLSKMKGFQAKLNAYKSRVLTQQQQKRKFDTVASSSSKGKGQKRLRKDDGAAKTAPKFPFEKKKKSPKTPKVVDPSSEYLKNPLSAPVCMDARHFFRKVWGNNDFKIGMGNKTGWRTTAKLSVRGNPPLIGLFAKGSHDVVETLDSPAHNESINKVLQVVKEGTKELKVKGYDGVNRGGLSYLGLNVETSTNKIQLICVYNDEKKDCVDEANKLCKYLRGKIPDLVHSMWLHCNPCDRHSNAIYGREPNSWHTIYGPIDVEEKLPYVSMKKRANKPVLYFPPYVFRQGNLHEFAKIVQEIRQWVVGNPKIVELYGGVGTIGLHCLDLCTWLKCSDENPFNIDCFNKSLRSLPKELASKASYTTAGAAKIALQGMLNDADMLIVDPPRKGLDKEVIEAISNSPTLKRIVYVSCGFKALQRDCTELLSRKFKIVHAKGFLLFPGANHVETLVVFDRV